MNNRLKQSVILVVLIILSVLTIAAVRFIKTSRMGSGRWGDIDSASTKVFGAMMENRDGLGRTALMKACAEGNDQKIDHLLQKGYDPKILDFQGRDCIYYYICSGKSSRLEKLLEIGIAENKDSFSRTRLHTAVIKSNHKAIEILLSRKRSEGQYDSRGMDPLHYAALQGDITALEIFRQNGSSLFIRTKNGLNALDIATLNNQQQTVHYLLASGFRPGFLNAELRSAVHLAAAGGNGDIIKILSKAGFSMNEADKSGITPLMVAVICRQLDAVNTLLLLKADINIKDHSGYTALHYAAQYNSPELVKALLEGGASVDIRDDTGQTPLHKACVNQLTQIYHLILGKVIDPHPVDYDGKTPQDYLSVPTTNKL